MFVCFNSTCNTGALSDANYFTAAGLEGLGIVVGFVGVEAVFRCRSEVSDIGVFAYVFATRNDE